MNKRIFLYGIIILITLGCNNNHSTSSSAVVTGHPEATKIGTKVLELGGNAIDASVAVQLALSVCLPSAGNIGGGGFMIYRTFSGEKYTLDFREMAPLAAKENMYLDGNGVVIDSLSTYGSLSIGIPGTIDGIFQAHEKFGSIGIDTLFNFAIELAFNGFPITETQANRLNHYQNDLKKFNPNNNYLQKKWEKNDTLKQKDLANTLTIIRDKGRAGFYEGEVAENIIKTIKKNGIISLEDLKNYTSIWRTPIEFAFDEYNVISMPPPSSGGVALGQLFMMLSNFETQNITHNSMEYIHLLSEIEKRVYVDRSIHLGDDDYVSVPIKKLMSKNYNQQLASKINLSKVTTIDTVSNKTLNESEETTHFSILDQYGNGVAVTTTLNTNYGSKVFVNDGGFLLNNEMDDFSIKPGTPNTYGLIGSEANKIEAGKRMLSSMTPTILEKNNELFLVLGTPGGSTIITSVFQTILNTTLFKMNIKAAVDAPRFHHQWKPNKIYMEEDLYQSSKELIKKLNEIGHIIQQRTSIGHVNAIMTKQDKLSIGADKRGDNDGKLIKH